MGLFWKDIKTMDDLLLHGLQDIYYAENQIVKSLPKLIDKATNRELKKGLTQHLEETKNQIARLDQVFKKLGQSPKGAQCPAIDGLITEADDVAGDVADKEVLDAAIVGAAQAVEHYEIARYGTLRTWAEQLGLPQSVELLDATLEEEKETDQKLTELAQSEANPRADTVYRVVRRVEPDVDGPAIDDEGELAIEERESDLENQAEEKGRRRVLGRDALGRKAQRDRALRADHP